MIEAIFTGIFNLIGMLFGLIIGVITAPIFALFPNFSSYFTYILNFLTTALTYVSKLLMILCIPNLAITSLFNYLIIKQSIYLIRLTVVFSMNVYKRLKP